MGCTRHKRVRSVMVLSLVWLGCYGDAGLRVFTSPPRAAEPQNPWSPQDDSLPKCAALGTTTLRRLTRLELMNTANDLVGAPVDIARALPDDVAHFGFTNNADGLTVDPSLFERYETATAELAAAVVRPPPAATRSLPSCPQGAAPEACAATKLSTLARKAWRRPVADAELEPHLRRVREAVAAGDSFEDALIQGAKGVLLSPHFLFRIESNHPLPAAVDDFELATRLSYFLWSSMPDEALWEAAEAGRLSQPLELEAQTRRMLADPRASALLDTFADQWLQVASAEKVSPNATLFPEVDGALKDSMRAEGRAFFRELLMSGRPYPELLTADFAFINDRLARHYDLPAPGSSEVVRVQLSDGRRGGLLKQAGFLTLTSAPTRTSIVKRGQWVLQRLMCEQLTLPDNVVNELESNAPTGTTRRAQLEAHRQNPTCASCHNRIDPIGFGLEHYDAVGKWRDLDNGQPVDSRGILPGDIPFDGANELAAALAKDPRVAACAVKNLTQFALGRSLKADDQCEVERLTLLFEQRGARLNDLLLLLLNSRLFTHHQGDAP